MTSQTLKISSFLQKIPVSSQTEQKLIQYFSILQKWNLKINLVASKTIDYAWQRHFLDSAQIIKYLPHETSSIADLGTGAGFPGMVLGIIKNDFNLNFETYLIESNLKKCAFLQEVIRVCQIEKVKVLSQRIEQINNFKIDLVVARALSSLDNLLMYTGHFACSAGIFLKTAKIKEELLEAQKRWHFDYEFKSSISEQNGLIIIFKNLQRVS